MSYLGNLGTALSQSTNTLIGGHPDESLSARAYRERNNSWAWSVVMTLANTLFWWDGHHCRKAFDTDIARARELVALHGSE